jgi:uncharacterized protein (TIGR00369 family)
MTRSFGMGSGTALDRFPQPSCAAFLGYEFVAIDRAAGRMTVKFAATDAMLNPRGSVQGGFLTAMLDDAMGSMVVALTDGRNGPASVDIHTQYLRPAAPGPLRCEAELVQMGRTTVFTRATLYNEQGDIVATATQTARLLDISGQ